MIIFCEKNFVVYEDTLLPYRFKTSNTFYSTKNRRCRILIKYYLLVLNDFLCFTCRLIADKCMGSLSM